METTFESVREELAEQLEAEALEAISSGRWGRRKSMNQLLVVDCLNSNWTLDDFFMEFTKTELIDPWKVKKDWECLVTSKQVEEMFELHRRFE